MATAIVMPKQGNSVESCIIVGWKKSIGDTIAEGDILAEVETDKALLEVESTTAGTLLAFFFEEGDEVPVLVNIAAVGEAGEDFADLQPEGATGAAAPAPAPVVDTPAAAPVETPAAPAAVPAAENGDGRLKVSPRAKNLAAQKSIDVAALQSKGTGPGGRVIERDVQTAIEQTPALTPLAKSMVAQGGYDLPQQGSGISGRVMSGDLVPASGQPQPVTQPLENEVEVIPVKGIRNVIATRMLESLQTTAQLTLNASADARALLAYRKQLKQSNESLGLQKVTINDLILLAVSRTLVQYPDLNAHFTGDAIHQYKNVNLGVAVDTPRGLMVPAIKAANTLSLKQIAGETKRLATACLDGKASPDDLSGGTFTVTNLGSLGIESFTPVLNPPEVGILGVGNITLKPMQVDDDVQFIPHISLSLTINHQAVDGAPAARFLQALSQGLAQVDLLLAL